MHVIKIGFNKIAIIISCELSTIFIYTIYFILSLVIFLDKTINFEIIDLFCYKVYCYVIII